MSEFVERPEVIGALREIAETDNSEEGVQGDVAALLRERGIDVPEGAAPTMVRTFQDIDVEPLGPLCPDGSRARPVNCRPNPKGGYPICDWLCP